MEPLTGLDSAFLALETPTARIHVGAVLLLDPAVGAPLAPGERFDAIRRMIGGRLHLVPQFRQRAVRLPLDLLPPMWVDDPGFSLDDHVRRASLPAPGRRAELDELVGDVMARPLPTDRPLWEMVVVEGLDGDRTALVAKLHHAILDGVSAATTMAAFFDLAPSTPPGPAEAEADAPRTAGWDPPPLPSPAELLRHALASLARQPEAVLGAVQMGADALVEVAEHNRRLAATGAVPPPSPFHAPRTQVNGTLSSARSFARVSIALDDITRLRRAAGPGTHGGNVYPPPTFNDVILCAVGMATERFLERRGEVPERPLVALVPVSNRLPGRVGPAVTPVGGRYLGNEVSGMLVGLGSAEATQLDRLRAVAAAVRIAKEQEELAWGRLLEGVARATPHALTSWGARGATWLRLFDRVPPLFNLVVSTVPGPDVPLWVAGLPVAAAFPVGPVAHGVGLNVTTLTHHGTVHAGLLACRRRVPEVAELAGLLAEAVDELGMAAGAHRGGAG
ncbi:MAG: wax ester/triacylglycerol synthase family O-acyltransferase [Acidimicrobiales bacterium]